VEEEWLHDIEWCAVATTMEKISNDGVTTTMAMVKTGMEKKSQHNSPKRYGNSNEMQGVT